jgi:hypothetical protein
MVSSVEIAANNGHNQASFRQIPIHDHADLRRLQAAVSDVRTTPVSREEILEWPASSTAPMHSTRRSRALDAQGAVRLGLASLLGDDAPAVRRFYRRTASMGSPGVSEVAGWHPCVPAMTSPSMAMLRKRGYRTADRHRHLQMHARNAAGQALCEMTSPIIVRRAGAAEHPR